MNTTNAAVPSTSQTPDAKTTRVLFVSLWELGWKTWSGQLEKYSEGCAGLEAVHLRVSQPRWLKALSKELPVVRRSILSPKQSWELYIRQTVTPMIASGKFDVVFVSSQIMAPALVEPCRRAGVRFAVALDVTGPAYQRDLLNRVVPASEKWPDEQRIYSAADLCVPMSSWIADSLQSDFGVPAQQILVSPPSIATSAFSGAASPKQNGKLPRILFCGNNWERKGGPQLVRWHQELWSQKAELHIASSGAPAMEGLTNVVCHGPVPHERVLNELLPSSDIFCLPTQNDMSPFAITEAQAAGLPTVTSRIGGMSDLVCDGKSGFLVKPDDEAGFKTSVSQLLDDPTLRAQMRAGAHQHAKEHLDADVVFPRLLNRLVGLKARA